MMDGIMLETSFSMMAIPVKDAKRGCFFTEPGHRFTQPCFAFYIRRMRVS